MLKQGLVNVHVLFTQSILSHLIWVQQGEGGGGVSETIPPACDISANQQCITTTVQYVLKLLY